MPDALLRLLGLVSRDIRQITGEIGRRKNVSGNHAKNVLGWTTRPVDETVIDTARSLIDRAIVRV